MANGKTLKILVFVVSVAIGCVLLAGFGVAVCTQGFASGEAAGWMQAIGAVGAIVGAIWISLDQQRRALKRESEAISKEEYKLLRSIRDEIEVLYGAFKITLGDAIKQSCEADFFESFYYVNEEPFVIFTSRAKDFGLVENHDVRRKIIHTYAKFNGVLTVLKINNSILERRERALENHRLYSNVNTENYLHTFPKSLLDSADQIRSRYNEAIESVGALLEILPK